MIVSPPFVRAALPAPPAGGGSLSAGVGAFAITGQPATLGNPTGLLGIDSAQLAVMQQMWTDYQANPSNPATMGGQWLKEVIKDTADKTGTVNERYADYGWAAAWMYVASGDPTYAAKAIAKQASIIAPRDDLSVPGGNATRDQSLTSLFIHSWTRDTKTPTERSTDWVGIMAMANYWINYSNVPVGGATRMIDTDEIVVAWFMNAIIHYYNVPENTGYLDRLNRSDNGTPLGGITATGADNTTWRNWMKYLIDTYALNGDWFEGSGYNPGTKTYVMAGLKGLRSVYPGAMPELDAWLVSNAKAVQHQLGGVNHRYKVNWGDNEYDHTNMTLPTPPAGGGNIIYFLQREVILAATLAEGTSEGPMAQKLANDIVNYWGWTVLNYESALLFQGVWAWNPYASASGSAYPWATNASRHEYTGVGNVYVRRQDDQILLRGTSDFEVLDHFYFPGTDVLFYRNGELVIDHPEAYASGTVNNLLQGGQYNTCQIMAAAHFSNSRFIRSGGGTNWAYCWSEATGHTIELAYPPAPDALVSAKHRVVWYRDPVTGWDIVIARDDVNCKDPRALTPYGYSAAFKTLIDNFFAVTGGATKMRLFHAPNVAIDTSSASETSWTTPGGQTVKIAHLKPSAPGRSVTDTQSVINDPANWSDQHTNKVVRIYPTVVQDNDTLVNVWLVGSSGSPPTVALVANDNVQINGTVLVSFNANDVTVT